MKKVRMLLRVSSNQQLEADGDLSVQRQLVREYIESHKDWILDAKEYFEGSNSGYSNAVAQRDVLQEALKDAGEGEYDILVAYKDDRIGRRMWEIGSYVMTLKGFGVDIYTVTDGCISPESDDIMGQMMLALRYGNAQKSSSDTGKRVKDTAQKLVQRGKFMGGTAPYGYRLELSGEISKHGRALHHLVIEEEKAEVVRYIYELSLNKEFGSTKIAKVLNDDPKYRNHAPDIHWKSSTITSILTNPIYAGYRAYKRREKQNGRYRRLDNEEWIIAQDQNPEIVIVDVDIWNKVQERRKIRGDRYKKAPVNKEAKVITRNSGMLALIDVLYCGYCGQKMTNGSKYNYWTIKSTGERRSSRVVAYKCQGVWQGIPHPKTSILRADKIEPLIFEALAEYIGKLQEQEDVFQQIRANQNKEKKRIKNELQKQQQELEEIQKKISIMEAKIPDAMTGTYPLSLEELVQLIKREKEKEEKQKAVVQGREEELRNTTVSLQDWEELRAKIPTWQEVFLHADIPVKRVLVNKLIERIEVKDTEICIRFKINLNEFCMQPKGDSETGKEEASVHSERKLILNELHLETTE